MNKYFRILFYFILTAISCRHFLVSGIPVTHDGHNHLVRFANYKIAVREMQLPPRWAPNLVNGYGYPVFNYNYPLANIASLPFSVLNIHYEVSFKLIITLGVLSAFVGANYFLRKRKFSKSGRIIALTVFAVNPYVLTSIIFRGNIGEIMAWGILPWIFYFLECNKEEKKIFTKSFFALTFSLVLLFLSHNIAAFFSSILIIFYSLFNYANKYFAWKKMFFAFLWSFSIALWFWLPAIAEKSLINLDRVDLTINYYRHFPSISQLIRLPIEFGYSYWGSVDSMTYGLGSIQIVLILLSLIYLLKNKASENLVFFIAAFVLILAQLPSSKFLYEFVPFADFIQFPWRMALYLSIVLLPISALIFENLKPRARFIFCLILTLQIWQFWHVKPIDFRHQEMIDFDADAGTTSVNQENMPQSFKYAFSGEKLEPIMISKGKGQVLVDEFFGSKREYQLILDQESTIVESTAYFPGWETKANNLKVEYVESEEIAGRIAFNLPRGEYEINTRFTQKTWPRIIGNGVSFLSGILFVASFVKMEKRNKQAKVKTK